MLINEVFYANFLYISKSKILYRQFLQSKFGLKLMNLILFRTRILKLKIYRHIDFSKLEIDIVVDLL